VPLRTWGVAKVCRRAWVEAPGVRQALGHESLATTSVYVGLAREVMDQELQRNAL
jgi:hypothetical protein